MKASERRAQMRIALDLLREAAGKVMAAVDMLGGLDETEMERVLRGARRLISWAHDIGSGRLEGRVMHD